ncbi:MAG: CopD family protein [Phenylobacterium sp.]|uniref:CopD family protein n=1 Tax=Phenylobacterium sp. TaxID=1871053 RepID=UPI00391997B9
MNYDLLRGLHILSVIAWMAGVLYLPRLFAYHSEVAVGSEMDKTFQTMERKLYGIIMRPAMIATWVFGLALIHTDAVGRGWDFLATPWMITKLTGVVFITGWHQFLGRSLKAFAAGRNLRTRRFWLMTNELPFLAAIAMVIAVTTEFTF